MRRIAIGLMFLGCAAARPSPVDVVDKEVAAYNAQDADTFAATYAEDAVILRGGKVWVQGRKAIRDAYAGMFAKYPKCRARVAERKLEDQAVVDHEIITGRGPERPDPWDAGWSAISSRTA